MCGICGRLNFNSRPIEAAVIERMTRVLAHRGPDDEGVYAQGPLGLGHRRLSIIDLKTGHQPMGDRHQRVWIVYNGEIYNFPSLRERLETKGHRFVTKSDTEVILAAYEYYGIACLNHLQGMFAFAIWDEDKQRLFLARDRLGIKPLYYYLDNKKIVFASESKALLCDPEVPRELNLKGLFNFFAYGHAVAPDTIYQGIKKLLPGHYLMCQKDGQYQLSQYWDCPPYVDDKDQGVEYYCTRIKECLEKTVSSHLLSDVPVGAFLSGGIDSSAVVAFMSRIMDRPVTTFSVGFKGPNFFSELDDARFVANYFGTDHHELEVAEEDLIATLESLVYHYDEPFGDAAGLPTYLVSRFARQHVKVVLTGEGSDELFGGYRRYSVERFAPAFLRVPPVVRKDILQRLINFLPRLRRTKKAFTTLNVGDPSERYGSWLLVYDPPLLQDLFHPDLITELKDYDPFWPYRRYYAPGSSDRLNRIFYVDQKTWLVDGYLEKGDKASMAVGLEARVPFLDHALVEFDAGIPSRYKIKGLTTKYILKKALREILPERVLRKRKHGFSVPIDPWFRGRLQSYVQDILLDSKTLNRGLFKRKTIERLFHDHLRGKEVYDTHLWLLLNFELWHRRFMDGLRP
jgi:asparagine synthase (glutamine-hydrolysing)